MISDALTRLAGSTGVSAAPMSIAALTAATPILSEHWFDIADQKDPKRGGNIAGLGDIFAAMTVATSLASAAADATFRLQLITLPRNTLAGQTFTAATNDVVTCAGDFLPNGTLVTVSTTTTLPAGLAASTHYYVYRDDDTAIDGPTKFKLATTPSGSNRADPNVTTVVDITSTGSGTHTITAVPQIVADSGEVPLGRLQSVDLNVGSVGTFYSNAAADRLVITTNPLPHSPVAPLQRYVFARLSVSDNLSAGEVFIDCGCGVPDNRGVFHASGFQVQ